MAYQLLKPYTDEQYADFVVEHNHNNGRNIEETEDILWALEPNEIMKDGQPVVNENYAKELRLQEIERELIRSDEVYQEQLKTPVQFVNTHYYKPVWVDDGTYTKLITGLQAGVISFPQTIWDATELKENAVEMSQNEFMQLCMFLSAKQAEFFNTRKELKSKLLEEKQLIIEALKLKEV